jgi:alkanesulfonate monooxygenase SsuD/methylene tetrahydromethanopterin reductase-like flavin-dependent oxidoreductase (luciferase family)
MAGRSDFTDEEWNTLHRGLTGSGMLVSISERGFTSTFKETGAMAKFLGTQSKEANSQFARELAGTHGSGWKVTSSPDELRDGALAALREAVTILTSQAPEDLADYRELVLALAQRVSDAAPEGTDVEKEAIEAISQALTS